MLLRRPRSRPLLLTLLDAGLVLSASAAIVILLGGRTRFDVAGIRVALMAPTRTAIVAVVFAALRFAFGGTTRPFPALAAADLRGLDADRQRFAAPERATRAVWVYAAATLLGSLVWIVPHMRDLRQVPDPGDPLFSAWRVARIAHQLATDPVHLFDGNTFYPRPLTLTYSDATVLQGLIGAPFILSGADPLVVANLLTLAAFPACGLAFFFAAWRLTGDPRAALIAGLLGAWYPFHAEHYSHLELHWVMFVPLAVAAGLRVLAAPGLRTGLCFGGAVAAQWLSSMYIGVMLMSFLVPFMLVAAVAWRVRPTRALFTASAAAAGVLLPALLALGVPYMQSREARGERGPQEVSDGSAKPSDYGATHTRLASYAWHSRAGNRPERELYPGTTTLALAAVGLVPPLTAGAMATIVAGALTFDWSLGFKGLTYDDLYKRSVVHRGMRVPARFSVVVGAALALVGAFGARRAIRLGPGTRTQASICAALAVLVLVDLQLDPQVQPYFRTIPSIYAHVTSDMVLAELPRYHDVDYMYFSTRHWARLLGGYSGFMPGDERLEAAQREFPSPSSIARFRALGATHVTYNCRFDEIGCEKVLASLDANPDLRLVADEHWGSGPVRLYEILQPRR